MSKKTVRLEPYYLEDPEDERIPMSVASYAALLKPGFVLDMTQATESQERSTDYDTIWDARVGKDQGLNIVHSRKIDPESGNPTSMGLEASTFGLPEGSSASIKFETRWNKGNRSYLELQVEGSAINVDKIVKEFQETFRPPSDDDIKQLKQEMNDALRRQRWGASDDYAQMVLLWRPDDVDAIAAMGSAAIMSRDNDRAEKLMNRLLELKPDSYEARMNLGTVWKDRGDYDKAIEQYQAVVDLKPSEAFSHFILGTVYEEKGDTAKALECYRKAASMKKSPGPTDFPTLAKEASERLST
jgi:Flp pilus assembly protein TadD